MNRVFQLMTEIREENLDGTPGKTVKKVLGSFKCNVHEIDATDVIFNGIVTVQEKPIRLYSNVDVYSFDESPLYIQFNNQSYSIKKQNRVKKPFAYLLARKEG